MAGTSQPSALSAQTAAPRLAASRAPAVATETVATVQRPAAKALAQMRMAGAGARSPVGTSATAAATASAGAATGCPR